MICRAKTYSIHKRNFASIFTVVTTSFIRAVGGRFIAGGWLLIVAAALAILPVSASASSIRLPADEDDLVELLSTRTIDTLQYEQLLAFYALPISVPLGELVYLTLIFPDMIDMIPAGQEELSEYHPFDNAQIRRFFNDYPELEGFEPILRFNAAVVPTESNGEVVVGINRSSVKALKGHRIRFRRRGERLSAEGGIAFSDTSVQWQSRRVDVAYRGAYAHIGNFKQPIPGELTFGRFVRSVRSAYSDWLYGGSGAWNGISVDMREIWDTTVGASAFCHLRPAEVGGGVGANINIGKRARLFAGFTGFRLGSAADDAEVNNEDDENDLDDNDDVTVNTTRDVREYYYAHLYAEYKAKSVSATAEAAVPLAEESAAPALSLRLNYRVKGTSAEYHAMLYPTDDAFLMSRAKKQLLAEAGEKEPSRPIRKHAVRMTVPFISDAVKLIPELDFTESDGVRRIHGRLEARVRVGDADITAEHTAKFFTNGTADSTLRTTGATINYRTVYPAAIRASFQSAYGYRKISKYAYAVEIPTTFIPSTVVTPYVRGKYVSANEYRLGIKSEFHLYKKTWTGVTLEIPVNVKGADNVYIKVSSSYAF